MASWLFTRSGEVESWTTEHKSIQQKGGGPPIANYNASVVTTRRLCLVNKSFKIKCPFPLNALKIVPLPFQMLTHGLILLLRFSYVTSFDYPVAIGE